MRITGPSHTLVNWAVLPETRTAGDKGSAVGRVVEVGDMRVREVCYSAGYLADHWCAKGHVLLVLEGALTVEFQDGSTLDLRARDACCLADDAVPHRARSSPGAVIFVVD